jgi:hypothetical protein
MGGAADRDLALLHDLQQRRLDLGGGAVDLVGEQEVGQHRPELGVEAPAVGAVDAGPDEVRRDEVGGELDAAERPAEDFGERLQRQRLGEPRDPLQQDVAAGEQADEQALEHRVLPDDHASDLRQRLAQAGAGLVGERQRVVRPGLGVRRKGRWVVVEVGHR